MNTPLLVVTIVLGVVITILTLLQGKGGGFGSAWGGTGGFQTRRGLEKWMLRATGVLVFAFFIVAVLNLLS